MLSHRLIAKINTPTHTTGCKLLQRMDAPTQKYRPMHYRTYKCHYMVHNTIPWQPLQPRSNVGATLYAAVGALFHMCMCLHKYYHGTRSCARSACMNVFMLGRSFAPRVCARLASRNVTEKQQNMTLTNVQVMRVRTEYALHIVQKRVVQERPCGETIILHCLFRVFNE